MISSIFPLLVLAFVFSNASGWCYDEKCEAIQEIVPIEEPCKCQILYKGWCIGAHRDCILVTGGCTPAIPGQVIKHECVKINKRTGATSIISSLPEHETAGFTYKCEHKVTSKKCECHGNPDLECPPLFPRKTPNSFPSESPEEE